VHALLLLLPCVCARTCVCVCEHACVCVYVSMCVAVCEVNAWSHPAQRKGRERLIKGVGSRPSLLHGGWSVHELAL